MYVSFLWILFFRLRLLLVFFITILLFRYALWLALFSFILRYWIFSEYFFIIFDILFFFLIWRGAYYRLFLLIERLALIFNNSFLFIIFNLLFVLFCILILFLFFFLRYDLCPYKFIIFYILKSVIKDVSNLTYILSQLVH